MSDTAALPLADATPQPHRHDVPARHAPKPGTVAGVIVRYIAQQGTATTRAIADALTATGYPVPLKTVSATCAILRRRHVLAGAAQPLAGSHQIIAWTLTPHGAALLARGDDQAPDGTA